MVHIALAALLSCTPRPDVSAVELRTGPITCCDTPRPDDRRFIVALDRPAGVMDTEALRQAGLEVHAALPGHAWLVTAPTATVPLPPGAWATPLRSEHRLSPEILGVGPTEADPVIVVFDVFPDTRPEEVATELGLVPTGVGQGLRFGRLVVLLDASRVAAERHRWADHPDVAWVGRRAPRRLLNDQSAQVGQGGTLAGATPIFDKGILGQGQIAGILDSGIDADHCMFADKDLPLAVTDGSTDVDPSHRKIRVVDFLWDEDDPADPTRWDDNSHGTHTAGTIVGDAGKPGVYDRFDGMAPAATIVVQDGGYVLDEFCTDLVALGCPVADMYGVLEQARAQGAMVHSNSWGDIQGVIPTNIYTDATEDIDGFTYTHDDMLVVFAAGNSGPYDETVGNPATAKNCLAVAATLPGPKAEGLVDFSSRGPTDDGRIKPDIAFPGVDVISASSDFDVTTGNCDKRRLSGTSMAAPGAAGMALLVRQYFTEGWYPTGAAVPADGFTPTSALLKAALIHSATPMLLEDSIPATGQGWGRIQLDRVLAFSESPWALHVVDDTEGLSEPGQQDVLVVQVEEGTSLSVTLVYNDYPSTPSAKTHLVNDLDLQVIDPVGAVYAGNDLVFGSSVSGGDADRVNNVEAIRIATPYPGEWSVVVAAHDVPMGPQPYALVLTADGTVSDEPVTETGGDSPPLSETGDTADPDTATDDTAGDDTDSPPDSDGPPPTDTAIKGKGCGCNGGAATGLGWLLVLAVLRRRTHARPTGT